MCRHKRVNHHQTAIEASLLVHPCERSVCMYVLQGATPVGTREGILSFFPSLYLTPYFLLFARNKKERSPIQCFRINEGSTGGLECTKLQNERAYCFSLCSPLFDASFLSPFLYLTLSRYYHRLPPPLSSFHSFFSSLFFIFFFSLSFSFFSFLHLHGYHPDSRRSRSESREQWSFELI